MTDVVKGVETLHTAQNKKKCVLCTLCKSDVAGHESDDTAPETERHQSQEEVRTTAL